jgi:hypothetical protein
MDLVIVLATITVYGLETSGVIAFSLVHVHLQPCLSVGKAEKGPGNRNAVSVQQVRSTISSPGKNRCNRAGFYPRVSRKLPRTCLITCHVQAQFLSPSMLRLIRILRLLRVFKVRACARTCVFLTSDTSDKA